MKPKRDEMYAPGFPDKTERKFRRSLRRRKDLWKLLCKRGGAT